MRLYFERVALSANQGQLRAEVGMTTKQMLDAMTTFCEHLTDEEVQDWFEQLPAPDGEGSEPLPDWRISNDISRTLRPPFSTLCAGCNGSGQGRYENTTCLTCKGSGHARVGPA